jgi:hypothetical protein
MISICITYFYAIYVHYKHRSGQSKKECSYPVPSIFDLIICGFTPSVRMFIGQGLSLEARRAAQAERQSANTATAPASVAAAAAAASTTAAAAANERASSAAAASTKAAAAASEWASSVRGTYDFWRPKICLWTDHHTWWGGQTPGYELCFVRVHTNYRCLWTGPKIYSPCPDRADKIYSIRKYTTFILGLFRHKSRE